MARNIMISIDRCAPHMLAGRPPHDDMRPWAGRSAAAGWPVPYRAERHVMVSRHKVTTLRPLVSVAASQTGQEANMAETVLVTPRMQTECPSEKTFTRRLLDTLRSHPSCISARSVPLTDGAADVSGR